MGQSADDGLRRGDALYVAPGPDRLGDVESVLLEASGWPVLRETSAPKPKLACSRCEDESRYSIFLAFQDPPSHSRGTRPEGPRGAPRPFRRAAAIACTDSRAPSGCSMTDGTTRVEFTDVEVLDVGALLLTCRISDRIVFVPRMRVLPGTTIRRSGDRGTLVLSRVLTRELGLV